MFKKPEDISPLPAGMMDAFTKTVNSQLGNYDVAQEAPAPEAPSAEAAIPEQNLEEGVKAEGNAFTKALSAARDNGDDEFIVSGKKYRVEDYDEDEEDDEDEDKNKKDKEELDEDNTNDKSDDGEGLDKVQPKAVKKKFKDRKDKDIDNDGDVDDSDKYLHNRRKAISKALEGIDGRTKAFKEKVAKLSYAKEEAEELTELKNTHAVIDTAQDGKVVSVATNEKGAKSSIVSAERPPMNIKNKKTLKVVQLKKPTSRNKGSAIIGSYLNDDGTIARYEETGDSGKPEGFFSEEMNPTDHVRFNKETNMFCVYDKDGKKVYESEKEEEANAYATDNHDALMGKNDLAEISGKLNKKGEIEMTKANFAKVHKDYKTKIKGQPYAMQIDPKSGGSALFPVKFIKESVELDEAKSSSGYDLYHRDFSGAMQHAYAFAKKKGFIVDKDEIDSKVAMGPKRPSSGKTNKYILGTNKRKNVHIQVANLDNKRYELNMYIESLGSEDESKVKEIIGKLKGASKAHAGQAKDLEKAMKSESFNFEEALQIAEDVFGKSKQKNIDHLKTKAKAIRVHIANLEKLDKKGDGAGELVASIKKAKATYDDLNRSIEMLQRDLNEELNEAPITGIQGKDRKTYALELDKSGRKVMVRTKNQFGDIKTISLKQAAKLFEASDLEKLEEKKIDPADVDDFVATKGDKESAKMNIIVQLRKAADVKGNLDIVFADGKKQKVPANIIKIALDKYNSFRKPATKKKLIDGMSKSYRDMLKTLKTIKEYSEESESKES
jgi:predicted transcriptional regulator